MEKLQWKTRNGISPQGLARVYISCRPADFAPFFSSAADDILRLQNCALWYLPPKASVTDWESHHSNLQQMNLLVLLVTPELLEGAHAVVDREVQFALANHIPVLPLLQAPGLETRFNEKYGNLQALSPHAADKTALRYEQKLAQFLNSALLSDTLTTKIRADFDAHIFMSYRKKDRAYAQKLMKLIHRQEDFRDVAIWYDEFLTPGEDFNGEIRDALQKSAVFALAVTPNLLEEDNYVMRQEYPAAVSAGKPVVAVEMKSTDRQALSGKFKDLSTYIDPNDPAQLESALRAALSGIRLKNKTDAEHLYLMGLAYLNGIDVEVDPGYALQLLQRAAQAGILAATDQLVYMFASGKGVQQNLHMASHWQNLLVEQCRAIFYKRSPQTSAQEARLAGIRLMTELLAQGELAYDQQDFAYSSTLFREIPAVAEALGTDSPQICQPAAAAWTYLGHICSEAADLGQALLCYQKASAYLRKATTQLGIQLTYGQVHPTQGTLDSMGLIVMQDLCALCCSLGDLLMQQAHAKQSMQAVQEAENCFMELFGYLNSAALKDRYRDYRAQLATCYLRLGDVKRLHGQIDDARRLYRMSVAINKERMDAAKVTHDTEAYDDYALSCYFLGMADPETPDGDPLIQSLAIWQEMAKCMPQFPIYGERAAEIEPIVRPWLEKKYRQQQALPKDFADRNRQLQDVVGGMISTGYHSLFLHCDGSVSARGRNDYDQCQTADWKQEKLMAISAGDVTSWGLKENGRVIFRAGQQDSGLMFSLTPKQSDYAFSQPSGLKAQDIRQKIQSWSAVVSIDARGVGAALLADGTISSAGQYKQSNWKFSDGKFRKVCTYGVRFVGIDLAGNVVADQARTNLFPSPIDPSLNVINQWTDVVDVATGSGCAIGLKKDGSVCAVDIGQLWDVPFSNFQSQQLPDPLHLAHMYFTQDWTDIIAIAAGNQHLVGLRADGTVLATGSNAMGQCNTQVWYGIIAIAAQGNNTVGLRYDGTVVACGDNQYGQCNVGGIKLFSELSELEKRVQQIRAAKNRLQMPAKPTQSAPQPPKPTPAKPAKKAEDPAEDGKRKEFEKNLLSAKKGDVLSMQKVAYAFYRGEGTQKNLQEAEKWAQQAAREGSGWACLLLSDLYTEPQLRKYTEAVFWAKRAIRAKSPRGYWYLHRYYRRGTGVRKNAFLAWYYKIRYQLARLFTRR